VVCSTISGSAIDDMLVEHFAEEFKGKYKVDARTNARAMVRLRAQAEKLKKTLSANPMDLDTPINVECMMEDTDVSGMLRREQLEQMLDKHGYVAKLTNVVQGALDLADLKPGDVDTVEMVGGTSRIPALRAAVSAVFGQDPKTTVNAAESVARGCALAAAMLSPAFRVRDFSVVDWNTMPLKVEYSDGKSSGTVTLEQGVAVPSAKQIKLTARGPLSLRFLQASAATTPAAKEELIAEKRALVGAKVPGGSELKVSVGLDLDSCASVPSCAIETVEEVAVPHETPKPAQAVGTNDKKEGKRDKKGKKGEKDQKEEGADEDTVEADHVDGTGREGGDAPMPDVPEPKSKTVTRQEKIEVETVHYLGLSDKALAEATNIEFDLQLADRVVQETFAARNALEEYVYRMRDALATTLADFADESVKASFLKALDSTEVEYPALPTNHFPIMSVIRALCVLSTLRGACAEEVGWGRSGCMGRVRKLESQYFSLVWRSSVALETQLSAVRASTRLSQRRLRSWRRRPRRAPSRPGLLTSFLTTSPRKSATQSWPQYAALPCAAPCRARWLNC